MRPWRALLLAATLWAAAAEAAPAAGAPATSRCGPRREKRMDVLDSYAGEDLARLLAPMLSLDLPPLDARQHKALVEGTALPAAAKVLESALSAAEAGPYLPGAAEWARRVVRPEALPGDLERRLLAIRSATQGEDAIVAAWETGGRRVQFVLTRHEVHVLTELPGPLPAGSDAERAARALAQARMLLRLPDDLDTRAFVVERQGNATVAFGPLDPTAVRDWHQALLVVTDGVGVKFSAPRAAGRTSPMEAPPPVKPRPWFPPPSHPARR